MEAEPVMTTCREFQVAIEMRLHGALEADMTAGLDEHLASCEACRRFETLARKTEGTMNTCANTAASGMDWERVRKKIEAMERGLHRELSWPTTLFAMAIGAATGAVTVWAVGSKNPLYDSIFLCVFLAVLIWYCRRGLRRRLQELKQVEGVREEIVQYYRKDVERRIKVQRRCMLPSLLFGLFFIGVGLCTASSATSIAFYVAWGLIWILLPLYSRVAVLPRLQRERKELG